MKTAIRRVLVVDDDPVMQRLYRRALRDREFELVVASSGPAALALLDDGFSVIVTDYNMPQMDGLAFIREVRARGVGTPVVLASADFDPSEIARGMPPGVIATLKKPFLITDLLSAIRMAPICPCSGSGTQ